MMTKRVREIMHLGALKIKLCSNRLIQGRKVERSNVVKVLASDKELKLIHYQDLTI